MSVKTAMAFQLSDVTNDMILSVRTRYARMSDQKRVELVSFRCNEHLMSQIDAHCSAHVGISQSMLVSDLVALGLTVYNYLSEDTTND